MKVPAAETPSIGTIIFNYGGPGAEGLINMGSTAELYLE